MSKQQQMTYTQIYLDLERRINAASRSEAPQRRESREERCRAIAEDYLAGMPLKDLTTKYGVSSPTVYSDLRKLGVSLRRKPT